MARTLEDLPHRAMCSLSIPLDDLVCMRAVVEASLSRLGISVIPYRPTNISSCLEVGLREGQRNYSLPAGWIKVDADSSDNRYPRIHLIIKRIDYLRERSSLRVRIIMHRDIRRHEEDKSDEAGWVCLAFARDLEKEFPVGKYF